MKTEKSYSELYTMEDFINYYTGACRGELKAVLKTIGNSRDITKKNERRAVTALLL